MTKVVITGASGFAGSHLIDYLRAEGNYEITGTVFGSQPQATEGWHAVPLNLTNESEIHQLITAVKPDWVFHLAALSSPSVSFRDHHQTLINNITAQAFLLDAIKEHSPLARTLIIGSAEEYGKVNDTELPIKETQSLLPLSPYAVSKVTQDLMAYQYTASYHLDIVRVRPFNHTGDRQTSQFVIPAFAEQIAKIEAGLQEPIMHVGNLTATRDFTDVKDIVRAYVLALKSGKSGDVYNLGSGKEVSIQSILDKLIALSTQKITLTQDPNRMLSADIPRMSADCSKFTELTGWQPEIALETTLSRVLDYWRIKVKS